LIDRSVFILGICRGYSPKSLIFTQKPITCKTCNHFPL